MKRETKMLQWGILSTGKIAHAFARALSRSQTGRLVAVGSRARSSADAFADQWNVPRRHGRYEDLLADDAVQAVYVATPHPMHAEWSVRAAAAGKHVLCEKPLAMNRAEADRIAAAARENGVFLMEAFMYRCHPQTAELARLIRAGTIGEVRMIRAAFGFGGGDAIDPASRLFDPALGGGGIMDVGCYPVSMSRLIAGAALGRPFANPVAVAGAGRVGRTGVDEWAAAVLRFEGDIIAQVATSLRCTLENTVEVYGSAGRLAVPDPWLCDREKPTTGRIVVSAGGKTAAHEVAAAQTSFAFEADVVARAVAAGRVEAASPAMTWEDSLGNMAALDAWRAAAGVVYPADRPAAA